jgi:ribokinase
MGRLFVIGNAGLDLRLPLPRPPRLGETLLGEQLERAPGGKGFNQAVVAARCGAEVHFHAPLGDDPQGAEIAALVAAEGFACTVLPRLTLPTDFSLLMVFPGGENSIVSSGPCAKAVMPDDIKDFLADARTGDVLLLQGNLSQATTEAALVQAKRQGALTILNTAPVSWDARALLPHCTLAIANRDEAETIAGPHDAVETLRTLGAATAIVTLGAEGCLLGDAQGRRAFPAVRLNAIDTTGCGDTFCGVIAACLAAGLPLDTAIPRAQSAAAITATRPGAYAALPSASELRKRGA